MAKPTTIARALVNSDGSGPEADGATIGGKNAITNDEADRRVGYFAVKSHDADADVSVVERDRLLQILHLQEQLIDDEMWILLDKKPVDELSPGQRSSAMLPLVALRNGASRH